MLYAAAVHLFTGGNGINIDGLAGDPINGTHSVMDGAKRPEKLLSEAAERLKSQMPTPHHADFWILDEWFYIPLLNLFTVSNFDPALTSIARRLGLTIMQVADALARLRHHGYLRVNDKGVFELTDLKVRFPTDKSYAPVRRYHKNMIAKAGEEITADGVDARYLHRLISSVCFAGNSEKIKEARAILEEAMYKAANLMADEPVCDEVYQLNVQIFPLTRPDPK